MNALAKLGIPTSLSLSSSEQQQQTASSQSDVSNRGSGFRSSISNNFALGGSSLTASQSDASSWLPKWALWAIGAAALIGGVWYVTKGKK